MGFRQTDLEAQRAYDHPIACHRISPTDSPTEGGAEATENKLKQCVQYHQVEINRRIHHINQIKALTYDR
jgi:hypothetical protein